jgi:hypothetical protein
MRDVTFKQGLVRRQVFELRDHTAAAAAFGYRGIPSQHFRPAASDGEAASRKKIWPQKMRHSNIG